MAGSEGVYAIFVICLLVLISIVTCVGLRLIQRSQFRQETTSTTTDEWQPLTTVFNPVEIVDEQVVKAVHTWQSKHPPNTTILIDVSKNTDVINKGVRAWKFIETDDTSDMEEESNAAVMDDETTIVFCQGQGSIMTNLPVPTQEFVYWEVKILQLEDDDTVAIGLATLPYPRWRLPGWHRHSVAYHSNHGSLYVSNPAVGRQYGPPIKQGDVIGVGYLCQSGTVFFTRNGENLGKAIIGFRYPIYPIIGSIGPCHVYVNFGFEDYLFTPANQREAAFGPKEGNFVPPPAYDVSLLDTILFDSSNQQQNERINNESGFSLHYNDITVQPPPPTYY
ncbi:concanavalin A-like lectin/glucanase domain-containing protein [Pilobolus umbonatus]|nr:concanavalin A-like lectin/glucanase domain-containing protein [Pilobolus umbonatus]